MWQRPTRITMGCKFVVVSNFWKSRRKKEFCNDYRIKLKYFLNFDIVLWTLLIGTKNVRNSSSILSNQYHYFYEYMLPRRFQFHSCFFTLNNIIEWQKIVCGQIRYKHEPAAHLSMPNNLNILDIRFFVLSMKNVSTLCKIVLHFSIFSWCISLIGVIIICIITRLFIIQGDP